MENEVFTVVGRVLGASSSSIADHHDVQDCAALWRHALISQTLDAAQRLAVFGTSRAAFSHVMHSAPHATISLQLYGAEPASTTRKLALAANALAVRGRLPTKVVVEQADDLHATLDLVHDLLLKPLGTHLTQLSLQLHRDNPSQAASDFLTAASAALPNLQQLHLGELNTPLPPGLFPQLTELQADVLQTWLNNPQNVPAVCSSITPHLPQLTTLTFTTYANSFYPNAWADLFAPTSTMRHLQSLRHLHTNAPLDNTLLSLLLKHAPTLQTLSVGCLLQSCNFSMKAWNFSKKAWRVRQITLKEPLCFARHLLALPSNSTGQKVVVACLDSARAVSLYIDLKEQGATLGIRQKQLDDLFSRFDIAKLSCDLVSHHFTSPWDRIEPLTAAMHQLASKQQPHQHLAVEVDSNHAQWSPDLLECVSEAAAALPQLHVTLSFDTLDDFLLDDLMQHAPAVSCVKANSLKLRDTGHSSTQRPWSSLTVESLEHFESLLCLPTPSEGSRLVEGVTEIALDFSGQVESAVVDATIARLQRFGVGLASEPASVHISATATGGGDSDSDSSGDSDRSAEEVPAADQPAVLRARLRLLRGMRLVNSQGEAVSSVCVLRLHDWTLTPAVVAELAGLPHWGGELWFGCIPTLPADAAAEVYQQLGRVLPVTYTSWKFDSKCTVEQLVEVCRGVAEARVGLEPLKLSSTDSRLSCEQERLYDAGRRKELRAAVAEQHLEKAVHIV